MFVEDDENKRNQVLDLIDGTVPRAKIVIAKSYQSGLRAIVAGGTDLVILDMSLPTFDYTVDQDGGRMQAYGGREILRQMDRRGIILPVIIVTQFDKFGEGRASLTREELNKELQEAHKATYKGMVYYNVARDAWKESLKRLITATIVDEDPK